MGNGDDGGRGVYNMKQGVYKRRHCVWVGEKDFYWYQFGFLLLCAALKGKLLKAWRVIVRHSSFIISSNNHTKQTKQREGRPTFGLHNSHVLFAAYVRR